jgi:hypothetical protein
MPAYFESAIEIVTEGMVGDTLARGPDPVQNMSAITANFDAGSDEVYMNQIDTTQKEFFEFHARELRPRLEG